MPKKYIKHVEHNRAWHVIGPRIPALTKHEARVFGLRKKGLTFPEIGRLLGLTAKNSRNIFVRCLEKMKDAEQMKELKQCQKD